MYACPYVRHAPAHARQARPRIHTPYVRVLEPVFGTRGLGQKFSLSPAPSVVTPPLLSTRTRTRMVGGKFPSPFSQWESTHVPGSIDRPFGPGRYLAGGFPHPRGCPAVSWGEREPGGPIRLLGPLVHRADALPRVRRLWVHLLRLLGDGRVPGALPRLPGTGSLHVPALRALRPGVRGPGLPQLRVELVLSFSVRWAFRRTFFLSGRALGFGPE